MADFHGQARTNFFRVKDVEALKEFAEENECEVEEKDGLVALFPTTDAGYFISSKEDEETGDYEGFDFPLALSEHLQEGSVAVIMASGSQKLVYLSGFAEAVNHKGERVFVDVHDIYKLAREKFGDGFQINRI